MRSFQIEIPDAALDDLRTRLAMTRYPDQIAGSGWQYGMDLETLCDFVDYWRDGCSSGDCFAERRSGAREPAAAAR